MAEATEAHNAEYKRIMGLYGSVPVEEFDALRAGLADLDAESYRTLREDYEFWGASDGEVQADYRCSCTVCGLSGELKASKRFWPPVDPS
jgi:hypothetical protein